MKRNIYLGIGLGVATLLVGYGMWRMYDRALTWNEVVDLVNRCEVTELSKGHKSNGLRLLDGRWRHFEGSPRYESMLEMARSVSGRCGFEIKVALE